MEEKTKKIVINLVIIIIVLNSVLLFLFWNNEDPVVSMARPYFSMIDTSNSFLEDKAMSITSGCYGSKECKINEIYRYVIKNYKYKMDPLNKERIKSPSDTINAQGGDCEDFAILLNSLLGNIGIKTYLVLTTDHAYSLACGINLEDLQEEIIDSFRTEENLLQDIIFLEQGHAYYYGWDGKETNQEIVLKYTLKSTEPVNIQIVKSRDSLDSWSEGEPYESYRHCSKKRMYQTYGECTMDVYGGILIANMGDSEAEIDLQLGVEYLALDLEEFFTHDYEIEGETCVVLDATTGEYSYLGYSAEITDAKIAIDPVTEEYWEL
jgi:hypothetical protein